jgi:hypothetical protein
MDYGVLTVMALDVWPSRVAVMTEGPTPNLRIVGLNPPDRNTTEAALEVHITDPILGSLQVRLTSRWESDPSGFRTVW